MLPHSLGKVQKHNKLWLVLVGAIAFLISFFLPTRLEALLGRTDWAGGIYSDYGISFLMRLGWLAWLPLVLATFTMLLWRRIVNRPGHLAAGRGLLTFLLAAILAPFTLCVLYTIALASGVLNIIMSMSMGGQGFVVTGEGLGFFWLMICLMAVGQTLYALPFLLIAGALIGNLQDLLQAHRA